MRVGESWWAAGISVFAGCDGVFFLFFFKSRSAGGVLQRVWKRGFNILGTAGNTRVYIIRLYTIRVHRV